MTLSYTDGKLTGIDRDSTALARYAYSGQRLTKLTDAEADYSLSFTYSGGRASSYTESAGGSSGVRVGVSYPNVSQTVYRDYGTDRTANTGDDLLTSYLFDYAGRTVNAYTTTPPASCWGPPTPSIPAAAARIRRTTAPSGRPPWARAARNC